MTRSEVALVEDFRRKSCQIFHQTNDGFHSLMMKGFDSMGLIFSQNADRNQIQRALRTLDSERKISVEYEDSNADSVRLMMYGFIEAVHLTLRHLTQKNDEEKENFTQLNAELQKKVNDVTNEMANLMGEVNKLTDTNGRLANENGLMKEIVARNKSVQDKENELAKLRSTLPKNSNEVQEERRVLE
ncbi:hypothetical protein PENTCL1PPCAC_5764 [Pristionchus entomophagus]|uniref:Uncharacterized protein n=1 Tax=Pristionchus entomophagus TaxID=358040 RepID=A0AAV5STU0_9BILA|nr:hypothetical protein PENTCL1PPCAC_5764 [Pristionchus entomophagus]